MSFCPNPNSKAYKELSEFLNDDQINELYGKFVSDDFIKFYFSINDISSDFLKRYKEDPSFLDNLSIAEDNDNYVVYNSIRNKFIKIGDLITLVKSEKQLKEEQNFNRLTSLLEQKDRDIILNKTTSSYSYKGKEILNRVTNAVKVYYAYLFNNANKEKSLFVKETAKKGTIIHSYAEEIIKSILNNTTIDQNIIQRSVYNNLLNNPEFEGYEYMDFNISNEHFGDLKNYFFSLIKSIKKSSPKAKIYSELKIVDENKNIAGTIDLLVVYPDGTIDLYDWKSMLYGSFIKDTTQVKDYKIEAFNIQLREQSKILKESYGVNPNKIIKRRIVPISMQFKMNGKKAAPGFESITIIDQISLIDELTRLESLNTILNKLRIELRNNEKQLESSPKDERLKYKINNIKNTIQSIQKNQDASLIIEMSNNILNLYKEKEEAGELDFAFINSAIDELRLYSSLIKDINNFIESQKLENLDELTKNNLQELNKKISTIQLQIDLFQRNAIEKTIELIEEILEQKNIKLNIRDISDLGELSTLSIISDINNDIIKALQSLVLVPIENDTNNKTKDQLEKFDKAESLLKEYANNKGISFTEALSKIFDSTKKQLMEKFSPEIKDKFSKLKSLLNVQDDKIRNSAINEINSIAYFDKKAFDDYREKYKKILANYNSAENLETALEEEIDKVFDVTKFKSAYHSKNYFIKLKNEDKNYSKGYSEITKDAKLIEIYNTFREFIDYVRQNTDKEIRYNFTPNKVKGTFEALQTKDGSKLFSFFNNIINSISTTVNEDAVTGTKNAIGEEILDIPLYLSQEFLPELSEQEIDTIKSTIKLKEGTIEYRLELDQKIYEERKKRQLAEKSEDYFKNFKEFALHFFKYEASRNREDIVKALKNIVEDSQYYQAKSITGEKLFEKFTDNVKKVFGVPKNTIDIFNKIIKQKIYGQHLQSTDRIIGEYKGKKISQNKLILQILKWFSINVMGGNWKVALVNFIGVTVNRRILRSEGQFLTKSSTERSFNFFLKNPAAAFELYHYLAVDPRGEYIQKIARSSKDLISRFFNVQNAYILNTKPEEINNSQLLLGMMAHYRVIDGKIVNPNNLRIEGESNKDLDNRMNELKYPTLLDKIKFKEVNKLKDGKTKKTIEFEIEEVNQVELDKFKAVVRKVISQVSGSVVDYDQSIASTNIFLRLILTLRNWIPPIAGSRFTSARYDTLLDTVNVGRYAVFIGDVFSGSNSTINDRLKEFKNLLFEVTYLHRVLGSKLKTSRKAAQFFYERFMRENLDKNGKPLYDITFEQFVALRTNKLHALADELRVIIGFMTVIMILAGDWDEDDKPMYKEYYGTDLLYRILSKSSNELTFFINPSSVTSIVSSFIPSITILEKSIGIVSNGIDEWRDFVTIKTSGKDKKGLNNVDVNDQTPLFHNTMFFIPVAGNLLKDFDVLQDASVEIGTQKEKKSKKD